MVEKQITVVGLGYIGLPTAIILAKAGHHVMGYDAKKEVTDSLKQGKIHIVENHLQEAFDEVYQNGHLQIKEELPVSDIYILCVPTPFYKGQNEKKADLSYVFAGAKQIGSVLKQGDLVILESTVPPHTTSHMSTILAETSGLREDRFYTAHCPERVLPGRILYELTHNDRIIGAASPQARQMTKELYESFVSEGTCYVCDDVTAEMCKLVENTYRDINIAFANQLSMLCDCSGVNVHELITLANKHPRVNILQPGLGVGGHCLAVDPWFLVEAYQDQSSLIKTAREINDAKPYWIKDKIKQQIKVGSKIGILGMAYKPNIDDMRESPSLVLAKALQEEGYKVYGCEPNSKADQIQGIPLLSLSDILNDCDCLVVALAHKEFMEPAIKEQILHKTHIDCIGYDELSAS